jgi:hypothetical protein
MAFAEFWRMTGELESKRAVCGKPERRYGWKSRETNCESLCGSHGRKRTDHHPSFFIGLEILNCEDFWGLELPSPKKRLYTIVQSFYAKSADGEAREFKPRAALWCDLEQKGGEFKFESAPHLEWFVATECGWIRPSLRRDRDGSTRRSHDSADDRSPNLSRDLPELLTRVDSTANYCPSC